MCIGGGNRTLQPQLPPELAQLQARQQAAKQAPTPAPVQQLSPFQTPDFAALFGRPPAVPQIPGMGGQIVNQPGLFMPRVGPPAPQPVPRLLDPRGGLFGGGGTSGPPYTAPNGRPRATAPGSAQQTVEDRRGFLGQLRDARLAQRPDRKAPGPNDQPSMRRGGA